MLDHRDRVLALWPAEYLNPTRYTRRGRRRHRRGAVWWHYGSRTCQPCRFLDLAVLVYRHLFDLEEGEARPVLLEATGGPVGPGQEGALHGKGHARQAEQAR